MAHYRIEALVESGWVDEGGQEVQEDLESIDIDLVVHDLSIYEVAHLPSHADRVREEFRARWESR